MTHRADPPVAERRRPRVLIVDDSAVARAALSRFISGSGRFDLAGALPDAQRALAFLHREPVDFILLDLVMPHQSGIDALPELLKAGAGARVLVVSSSAAEGAAVTMRALALGAADTLVKPSIGAFASRFGETLLARLDLLAAHGDERPLPRRATIMTPPPFDAIAIGASTGGIHALASLLEQVPVTMTQPIFVTQHLPPSFSPYFAAQVGVVARRPSAIAHERRRVVDGEVLIAPGDAHLLATAQADGQVATRLSQAPSPTGNLPSVDPMFTSLARTYGARLLAIVLTGMGRDGLDGARAVRASGGTIVVQDRESSVVWGMPGAVAQAGLADAVLTPREIGAMIAARRMGARG